ncbi:GH25 family lysozyme [Tropicimonas sp.]|uniref:glycoside hydrolase family 25 protein n=1 Tax=Tropicimonas sp. TaxID=2067044 RepID=UPI003A85E131
MRPFALLAALLALLAACGGGGERMPNRAGTSDVQGALALYPAFGDADPHEWQGRGPRAHAVHGIDVSRYQGPIDWRRVRNSGVNFAYIKATEGAEDLDPMFREHWNGARRAGLPHGAYHFYYFCRSAEEQARWFIRNVPKEPGMLPPVLDMEWNPYSPTCLLRPDGAVVRSEARKFLDILERHYGQRPILYTGVEFWRDTGIGRLGGTRFWLRSVAGHPSEVYPGAPWHFWQYTGTGLVPGVPGQVDINVFRGSAADWDAWAG